MKRASDWRIVRVMPDGAREIEFRNRRRMRVYFQQCPRCLVEKPEQAFIEMWKGLCGPCYREEMEEARIEYARIHGPRIDAELKARMAALAEANVRRRANNLRAATPRWVDKVAIEAIYEEARETTRRTGVLHHVDHIWPITHPHCCGLHVHWNLRVISATENCSKSNRLPVDIGARQDIGYGS